MASEKTKKTILDAFLALLDEKPFHAIELDAIAARADVTLGTLRDAYDGKLSILADFIRRTDRAVLDEGETPSGEESGRDRLFDIVMRRLDRLAPHKAALGHIEVSVRRDPALLLCLNAIALDSARFMLASAGIGTGGLRGAARAQGFVAMMARVYPVWRDDTDPDQSRTMAALDRALERAESWERRSESVVGALSAVCRRMGKRGSRRKPASAPPTGQPVA